MLRVRTPSRLHFGLLSPAEGGARAFGGVGLMVERPGLEVSAEPADTWSAEGPLAERALAFAQRFAEGLPEEAARALPPQRLVVARAAPEHAGLGTGTQLGLAVGRLLASACGWRADVRELARLVGRGARSALGVYGFERGGFLVEGGKRSGAGLAPLVAWADFPGAWRVVLAVPAGAPGLHGAGEQQAFAALAGRGEAGLTDVLCRLVLLGLLPALAEGDLPAFGAALHEFNARVGEAFASVQGGAYAGAEVAALVDYLRGQGVRGVGQSSWGPGVFAVVGDEGHAAELAARVAGRFGLGPEGVWVTGACNTGAVEGPVS